MAYPDFMLAFIYLNAYIITCVTDLQGTWFPIKEIAEVFSKKFKININKGWKKKIGCHNYKLEFDQRTNKIKYLISEEGIDILYGNDENFTQFKQWLRLVVYPEINRVADKKLAQEEDEKKQEEPCNNNIVADFLYNLFKYLE